MKINVLLMALSMLVSIQSLAGAFGPSTSGGVPGKLFLACRSYLSTPDPRKAPEFSLGIQAFPGQGSVAMGSFNNELTIDEPVAYESTPRGLTYTGQQIRIFIPSGQSPDENGRVGATVEIGKRKIQTMCNVY